MFDHLADMVAAHSAAKAIITLETAATGPADPAASGGAALLQGKGRPELSACRHGGGGGRVGYGRRAHRERRDARSVRRASGALFWIAIAFCAFQLVTAAYAPLSSQVIRALHVGFLMLVVFGMAAEQAERTGTHGAAPAVLAAAAPPPSPPAFINGCSRAS